MHEVIFETGHAAASGALPQAHSTAPSSDDPPSPYPKPTGASTPRPGPHFFPYVRLYQVAEYLGSEACQNAVIDHVRVLARAHNAVPSVQDVRRLWGEEDAFETKGPGEPTALRKGLMGLMLDLFCALPTEKLVLTEEEPWYVLRKSCVPMLFCS